MSAPPTVLDLTSYQLHDLDAVELPPSLTELDLTTNRLSALDTRIGQLPNLNKLSLRQNLITDAAVEPLSSWHLISDLEECIALEELYLSHNGIAKMEGLSTLVNLRVLDVSANKLTEINDIENLTKLEDLWLNDNNIASLDGLAEAVAGAREKLTTIYLERNPCAQSNYISTLRQIFPNIEQFESEVYCIGAWMCILCMVDANPD